MCNIIGTSVSASCALVFTLERGRKRLHAKRSGGFTSLLYFYVFNSIKLIFKQNLFQEQFRNCIKRPRIFKKDIQWGDFHQCWFWSRSIIQTKLCPQTEVNSGKQHGGAPVPRACVACIHCKRSWHCCLNNLFARSVIEPEVRCCNFTARFWGKFWCPAVTTA